MSAVVENKLIGELQRRACNIATGYLYKVKCKDDLFCKYARDLFAYRVATANSCDDSAKVIRCVEGLRLNDCIGMVTEQTDCTITITDITPSVTCSTITFEDIT